MPEDARTTLRRIYLLTANRKPPAMSYPTSGALSWDRVRLESSPVAFPSSSRFKTCVTRARLTSRNRASAARLSNLPVSKSDW
jgi:hypothetical protein